MVETLTRRRIDNCAVQDTRWYGGICKSQNRMLTGKGSRYKFFWAGNKDGKGGEGILLAECYHICLSPLVWLPQCWKGQLLWGATSNNCINSYLRDYHHLRWLEWSCWQIQCWKWGSAWRTWLGHQKYRREFTGVCCVLQPGHRQHLF